MPTPGSPYSGLPKTRKLSDDELAREVHKDIAFKDLVHTGEFLELLFELSPDEEKLYTDVAKAQDTTKHLLKNDTKNQHIMSTINMFLSADLCQ